MEFADGAAKLAAVEIGPHAGSEDKFRIGGFPKQKVAQALLTARSNQQVDRGRLFEFRFNALARRVLGRPENGFARGIVNGESKPEAAPAIRGAFGAANR